MTLLDQVLPVPGDGGEGTAPSAVGDSWDCCAGLESPHQGAAAAGASGGYSGASCLGKFATVGARHQLHLVVAPVLVHLVQAGVEVLLVLQYLHQALHPVLDARLLNFVAAVVAAATASDAEASAGALQLPVTWSWGSPAAGLAVMAHPVVLLAAGDPQQLHPQAGVGKRGVSLVVPGQVA